MSRQIYAQVRLHHDEARVLDEYRRQCPEIPTRATALRDLAVAAALAALQARDTRPINQPA